VTQEQPSQDHLQLLREIRDGQQEIIALMSAQQALAEEQVKRSRESVEESVGLQRLALQRQRTITLVAIPAIFVCIAAICYLVLRYF
jgi:formate dehydrogenase maturation protein FdhE